jgi:hypothetical protein
MFANIDMAALSSTAVIDMGASPMKNPARL